MDAIEDTTISVLALAPSDPLDVRTFSGLSRRLFTAMREQGAVVHPLATRILRPTDAVTAPNWRGFVRGELRGRRAPRIDPDWYWSRAGYTRFSDRVSAAIDRIGNLPDVAIQVGTHVRVDHPRMLSFCVTDATVVQAVAADSFSVSRGARRTIAEAVENQRDVFARCRRIFVLSEWAASSVRDDYGIDADRVVVIGAGSNVPLDVDPPVLAGERGPRVLFVGMDWVQKGGPLVLDAFVRVRARIPEAVLTVVGCDPGAVPEGVEVVGRLDPRDPNTGARLAELYERARVFAIAPDFDAFPNVLLEAAGHGAVVVSTDRGSRGEVVRSGRTGLLAAHGDAEALAELMYAALVEDRLATRLAVAARERVLAEYTWERVAGQVLSVVRQDLEARA